jgi:HK97 family phage major capsid protein
MDNALKTISKNDTELRVANYLVLYGGRDLTGLVHGKNADGSSGEYFSKSVDLESEYTETGVLHVDFEHGADKDGLGNNRDNVLGYVDWKSAKADDTGVYVERVLNRRKRYMKWLEKLIDAGLVGNSTEAISGGVEKKDTGEITRWPLRRDTFTVEPMEPRMLTANALTAIKALAQEFPSLKALFQESDDTALTDPDNPNRKSINSGDIDMTEEEITVATEKAVATALAKRDAEQKAIAEVQAANEAAIKAAADAAYAKAVEDMKARRPVKYHSTAKPDDDNDGVGAFKAWMATGQENDGLIRPDASWLGPSVNEKAAWNITSGASGAFLVPDPLYNQIIAKRNIASWVRQVPAQFFETDADHILVPKEDTSHTDFVLTAEAAAYNQNEGTVAQKDLILYKYTNLTKVNEEFLLSQTTNWESWFANAMARAVAGTENTIFTTGTGSGQPEGIVTGATVANTTATTDIILPSELAALIGFLGGGYNVPSECAMLMANKTKWYLKGSGGTSAVPFAYVMTPQDGDFFGYKAVLNDDLDPYTTASAKCVVFGNFNFFGVVERPGMLVRRNEALYMANGQVGIFTNIYRGSGVLQGEAFYYLTNAS